jgi:hypothetical protein
MVANLDPYNVFLRSDFEDVRAHVDAVALAPGEYEVIFQPGGTTRHLSSDLGVRLAAGEIVYAGEIWMKGCGNNVEVTTRDSWERDKPMIETKFPDLPLHLVQMRRIDGKSDGAE